MNDGYGKIKSRENVRANERQKIFEEAHKNNNAFIKEHGAMLATGIDLINELLDKFTSDSIYISYLTSIDFVMIQGKATYSVSDMVPADIFQDRIVDLSFANYVVQPSGSEPIVYPIRIINK